jgi:hypothetical protein
MGAGSSVPFCGPDGGCTEEGVCGDEGACGPEGGPCGPEGGRGPAFQRQTTHPVAFGPGAVQAKKGLMREPSGTGTHTAMCTMIRWVVIGLEPGTPHAAYCYYLQYAQTQTEKEVPFCDAQSAVTVSV